MGSIAMTAHDGSGMLREVVDAEMRRRRMMLVELAERSGLSRQNIGDWLAGRRDLTSSRAGRLLAALGLEIRPRRTR